MPRRHRFKDRTKSNVPAASRFIEGEGWRERHSRRLSFNLEKFQGEAEGWAKNRGISLKITNGGHHWHFQRSGKIVEWWPSSAKCVVQKKWRNGIHVHDWGQLKPILAQHFASEVKQ